MKKGIKATAFHVLMVCCFCAFIEFPAAINAQDTGTLDGIVSDPTNAVIQNSSVELKDVHSNAVRSTKSNSSGVFSFSGVPTGDYQLLIQAKGFRPQEITGIHMNPGDQRSYRQIKLVVAVSGAESIIVTATAGGIISTDSGESSSLISSEDIEHLAIEGRDVSELLKILPGMSIVQGTYTKMNAAYDPSIVAFSGAMGSYAANGTQTNSTAMLNDGMDITDPGSYGITIQNVNYDQVAEVKVQTGSFTADAAHGPIVINAVGRAGGAQFHGSVYTYGRTHQLNSGDWYAKYTGSLPPQDHQVYPGFTISGPVLIPKTNFNHAKKLTFFLGAEEYAQRDVYAYGSASQSIVTALVPTKNMRKGDFSLTEIQKYLGSTYDAAACSSTTSSSYQYKQICKVPTGPDGTTELSAGEMNAYAASSDPSGLGQFILNAYPLPNMDNNGTYNYTTTDFVNSNLLQVHGRLDYSLSDKTKFFITYGIETGKQYQPANPYGRYASNGMGNQQDLPGGGFADTVKSHVLSLNVTKIITPTLTNEFYAGGAYFKQPFTIKNSSATQYSSPYSFVYNNKTRSMPSPNTWGSYNGLPQIVIEDGSLGDPFTAKQLRMAGDNATWVYKRHTLRTGAFYQWVVNPQMQQGQNTNGTFQDYYHGWQTKFTDDSGASRFITGNYLADNYLGTIGSFSQTNKKVETTLYFESISGYVQDHWLVNNHLSIDGGIRFEHLGPWIDAHGLGVAVFDAASYAKGTPSAMPGVLYHAIDHSVPLSGNTPKSVFFEPRAGFALDIKGDAKNIVRGGFGMYRQHESYNDALNAAETGLGTASYSTTSSPKVFSALSYLQTAATNSSGFTSDSSIYVRMRDDDQMPYVMTYNLMLDRRLPKNMGVEIAYVGNNANHLTESSANNINALSQGALFAAQPNSRTDTSAYAGTIYPFFAPPSDSTTYNTSLGNLDTAHIDSYRKYPLYNSITTIRRSGYSNYNGLQLMYFWITKRGSINANYSWSKALGAISGPDPVDIRNDYMPLNVDRRHIMNINYFYSIGKVTDQRVLGLLGNNWEISGILGLQSGTNLNSTLSTNFGVNADLSVPLGTTASTGTSTSSCKVTAASTSTTCSAYIGSQEVVGSPDYTLQPTAVGSARGKSSHQYVNGTVFRLPTIGNNGPRSYGSLVGPMFFNSDLTMSKAFNMHNGRNFQIRGAAFNFLNFANYTFSSSYTGMYTLNFDESSSYTDMNSALSNATNQQKGFGSTNLRTGRRVFEFSLKYTF
jgi:hypothetical protein